MRDGVKVEAFKPSKFQKELMSRKFFYVLFILTSARMSISFTERKHMALFYDSQLQRDSEIIRFINEGLTEGQLCIYGTIHVRDKEYFQTLSSRIADYEENVKKGNLLIVDFAPFYIAALSEDLSPYKQVQMQLEQMFRDKKDLRVRYVGDATGLLFKNRHFDECMMVEEWWQKTRMAAVTTLCLFQKSLIDTDPFNYQRMRVFLHHDMVLNVNGHGDHHSSDTIRSVGK